MNIMWFSAGVSSAVAAKLAINVLEHIIYVHIDDQHPDTMRFIRDCEKWWGKPTEVLQSRYKTVENACLAAGGRGYVNGPGGAACTRLLKRRVRQEWEIDHGKHHTYYWGFDANERNRMDRIREAMPDQEHRSPLAEERINKSGAHQILNASGIKRPMMYDLGYPNNNCVGCVKGGMGYWNKIRIDFPDVFWQRAALERRIGATCIKNMYLDELPENKGRKLKPIAEDCGVMCELLNME